MAKRNKTNTYSVYKISNKETGRIYIGITKGHFTRRWRSHAKHCHNHQLRKDFEEYGYESFIWEVLQTDLYEKRAKKLERDFIHKEMDKGVKVYNLSLIHI